MQPRTNYRQLGFTLLELMVAVTIIGILVAIAIPVFEAYRKRAYEASAITYMRSWVPAQELYFQLNGNFSASDEELAQQDLGVLFVPDDIPYDFSIDSTNRATERWWGRGQPTTGGLAYFYIDNTGRLLRSGSGPPAPTS
jgi:prepilin-type N-terminal cleavage/methylation domain-containing protein